MSTATQMPRLAPRSGQESRSAPGVAGPSLPSDGRHHAGPSMSTGRPRMPAKNSQTESGGFTAEERAAMKKRAAELRAEGKKGAKKADGLQAVLDSIAQMAPADRALAERVHMTVTATAPDLSPKTWYGMPAYANADGKIVVFLPERGQVQLPLLDPGLPGRGEPRRRRRVAGVVHAEEVEPHGGEEGRRPGEGRDLLTGAATAAEHPTVPGYSAFGRLRLSLAVTTCRATALSP